jgi:hypothetical protein
MARQDLVIGQNKTSIWAVLDEAVLRRRMGPPEIMQSQYQRLLKFAEENNITIQVLRLDTAVFTGVPAGFAIMRLPSPDPEVVVIEHGAGVLYLEQSEDVTAHADLFDRLIATATGPEESLSYISNLAKLNVE